MVLKTQTIILVLMFLIISEKCPGQTEDAYPTFRFPLKEVTDSMYVTINYNYDDAILISRNDPIRFKAGVQHLTISSRNWKDVQLNVELNPGDSTAITSSVTPLSNWKDIVSNSAYPVLRLNSNLLIVTDHDSELYINEEYAGTGYHLAKLRPGISTVTVKHAHGKRVEQVSIRPDRLSTLDLYNRPVRRKAQFLSLIPGAAQYYKDEHAKSALIGGLFIAVTATGLHQHLVYRRDDRLYREARWDYQNARTELEAMDLGNKASLLYDDAHQSMQKRNIIWGVAGGIYLLNIVDAFRTPAQGYRPKNHVSISDIIIPVISPQGFTLNLNLHF